jgi:hypothetical protein
MPLNPSLTWEAADHDDDHRDQNADTTVFAHGWWMLGDEKTHWTLELSQRDDILEEICAIGFPQFPDEVSAKRAAQRYENLHGAHRAAVVNRALDRVASRLGRGFDLAPAPSTLIRHA